MNLQKPLFPLFERFLISIENNRSWATKPLLTLVKVEDLAENPPLQQSILKNAL